MGNMVKKNKEDSKMVKKSLSNKESKRREGEVEKNNKVKRKFDKEKQHVDYTSYIFKLIKKQDPQMKVQKKSLKVLGQLCETIFESVMNEGEKLMKRTEVKTLSENTIKSATSLILGSKQMKHHALMFIDSHLNI